MKRYQVFVDESGGFSFRDPKSFICGHIVRDGLLRDLDRLIDECVNRFNLWLAREHPKEEPLRNPEDLHFFPLHSVAARTGRDMGVRVNTLYAPVFFRDLFATVRDLITTVFYSSGLPRVIANDHACYVEVLRHTLLQLFDDDIFQPGDEVLIKLAHRRGVERYGLDGDALEMEYETHLTKEIAGELREAFVGEKPRIDVVMSDARTNKLIMLADFFGGADRWEREDYLEDYPEPRRYSYSAGYRLVGTRLAQRLLYEFERVDRIQAANHTIEAVAAKPGDKELVILLRSMMERLNPQQRSALFLDLRRSIDDRLTSGPAHYDQLDVLTQTVTSAKSLLPSVPEEMSQMELRLHAALNLNQIRIDSHKGQTDDSLVLEHERFLDEFGDATFFDQMELMQERIELALVAVQIRHFNSFQFSKTEDALRRISKKYKQMFESEFRRPVTDHNKARLDGTLGQMCAFQGEVNKDEFLLEYAEELLKSDVAACDKGSPEWRQGMGYLTTLYWKMGDLAKAEQSFLVECQAEEEDTVRIYDFSDLDTFHTLSDPFLLLHRLYLCALAYHRLEREIKNLDAARNVALQQGRLHIYPRVQIAKWLTVLLCSQGEYEESRDLCRKALYGAAPGFTLSVIRLPLHLIQHYCLGALGRRSPFNYFEYVEHLEKQQPGTRDTLLALGFPSELTRSPDRDWFQLAALLPFYYS